MEGRTRVSDWHSARQYLRDLDIVDTWRESTVAEQREPLNGVFSKKLAGPDGLALHVRGLDLGLETSWHRGGASPLIEVAGPRNASRDTRYWCFSLTITCETAPELSETSCQAGLPMR
jgi:hypothetical protein